MPLLIYLFFFWFTDSLYAFQVIWRPYVEREHEDVPEIARDRVIAIHVLTQHFTRPSHKRIGREAEAQVHAVVPGIHRGVFSKAGAGHGSGGNTVFYFDFSAVCGDTRRTTVSAAHAENDGISVFFDFLPHFRFINKHDAFFVKDKQYLIPLRTPPYYALIYYPRNLGTIGGIKINYRMEVVDKEDNPIPGLYAAGQDTGGWQPETYNQILAGSAFSFAINSGRIAGENAAKIIKGE